MVTWFEQDAGGLVEVFRGAANDRFTGALAVSGRGGGGHVWLRGGRVVAARTDDQPALSAALVATGVADAAAVAELGRATAHPPMTPAVAAVADELAVEALARLVALPEGSVRHMPEDQPTLGLLSLAVDEVVARLQARRARERTRELGRRGHWTAVATPVGVQLDALEWELVVAMTRASSPADLVARTGREFGQVSGALRRLAERGHVRRETGSVAPPQPGATPPGQRPAPAPPTSPTASARVVGNGAAPARETAGASPTPPAARAPTGSTVPTTVSQGRQESSSRAGALRRLIGAVRAG